MVKYTDSYLNIEGEEDFIEKLKTYLLPFMDNKYPSIRMDRGYGVLQLNNENLESLEDSIDYFSLFLDEHYKKLKINEDIRILYYVMFSYSGVYECNLEFGKLHKLTKYLDNFCVSCYNYDSDTSLSDINN